MNHCLILLYIPPVFGNKTHLKTYYSYVFLNYSEIHDMPKTGTYHSQFSQRVRLNT